VQADTDSGARGNEFYRLASACTPFLSAPDRQFSRNRVFRSQHAVSGQLGGWASSPVGPFPSSRAGGFRQTAAWPRGQLSDHQIGDGLISPNY
jgi:hypothetical protein